MSAAAPETASNEMQAARMYGYGDADVLKVESVPRPGPLGPRDIRIQVMAAAVNPVDYKMRKGAQRAFIWLKFPAILGMDVSGVVTEVGSKVTKFSVGDEVISSPSHLRMGCYAEEVVLRADECALKPVSIDHVHAAALPLVGLTAWDCLVSAADVKAGEKVLIQAGSGGVGSIGIQLAKHLGAEVYTTCSPRNAEMVTELGADHVINYREEDWGEVAKDCDVILESMGGDDMEKAVRTVRRGGRVAEITPGMVEWVGKYGAVLGVLAFLWSFVGLWLRARFQGRKLSLVTRRADSANLQSLSELVDAGAIKPIVEKVYPLREIADAHRHVETGRTRGKIVLAVGVPTVPTEA